MVLAERLYPPAASATENHKMCAFEVCGQGWRRSDAGCSFREWVRPAMCRPCCDGGYHLGHAMTRRAGLKRRVVGRSIRNDGE